MLSTTGEATTIMDKEFTTDDLALAGFLTSRKHQLIELRPHFR